MIKVTFTGERSTEESAAEGMVAESGWMDMDFSRTEILDSPAEAKVHECDSMEDALNLINDYIGDFEPSERGTYYGTDAHMDFTTGDVYTYAAHVEA